MNVVIGVDGTERSCQAASFASRILSPQADRLVLYFSPPRISISGTRELEPKIPQDVHKALVESVFARAKASVPQGFRDSAKMIEGESQPAVGILAAADKTKADLIVVGTDAGRKGIVYVGRVARTVAQRARVPVLVFRSPQRTSTHEELRILVAYDGSSAADAAVAALNQFTFPTGSQGWLIRVLEWVDLGSLMDEQSVEESATAWRTEYSRYLASARERAYDELKQLCRELPTIFAHNTPIITDGHRVHDIRRVIAEEEMDLVVVGSRNVSPIKKLLGSTSEGILQHADCSVLLVHEQEKP
jgi:nucleotide-binding universal stress UspA family protein